MTPDQLTDALEAMQGAAGGEPDRMPGLILAYSKVWCDSLYAIERVAKTLDDGIRHREIKVLVSSSFETRVLTRVEAGERGRPYRDLAPRT